MKKSWLLTTIVLAVGSLTQVTGRCIYDLVTVCEKYAIAESVVIATVLEAHPESGRQRVILNIEQSFKGNLSTRVELDQPLSSCDWDFSNEKGERVLLYLEKNKGKVSYYAIGTGFGGPVERETDDLYWLRDLPRALSRNRISGTISLYQHRPFTFLQNISKVQVKIVGRGYSSSVRSDEHGVFQLWDVPNGDYELIPSIEATYKLDFMMPMGDILEIPERLKTADAERFQIRIGAFKCGGSNYVLNKRDE